MESVGVLNTSLQVVFYALDIASDLIFYIRRYGPAGVFLAAFGSRPIWQLQAEVLNLNNEDIAISLKKLVQEESQIVAVAASIIVQIAITALSLNNLSRAHWTARGSFVLSLVSATLAVYSASTQYRTFGQCINGEDVKQRITASAKSYSSPSIPRFKFSTPVRDSPSRISTPSIASVVTISAPFALLALALHSFLVGFGIWLGFVWTKNLDDDAAQNDSRAVFITYTIGLGTCYVIYALSNISAGSQQSLSMWVIELEIRMAKGLLNQMDEARTALYEVRTALSDVDIMKRDYERTARYKRSVTASTSQPGLPNEEYPQFLLEVERELRGVLDARQEKLAELLNRLGEN